MVEPGLVERERLVDGTADGFRDLFDGRDESDRWIDGEFVPGGGNLMWAWHTACGVALAGSVQHAPPAPRAGSSSRSAAAAHFRDRGAVPQGPTSLPPRPRGRPPE